MALRVVIAADGFLDPDHTPGMDHDVTFVPYDDLGALTESLAEADAFVTRRVNVTAEFLRNAGRLRLVQQVGVGTDRIDLAATASHGIAVANTPGAPCNAVVEYTFLMILSAYRNFATQLECIREGGWSGVEVWEANEISGKTLGIIGYGVIGRGIARRALAFDARVLVTDIVSPPDVPDGVSMVDLETLMRESDIVVVAASLTPETRGLIDRDTLALMKPSGLLVNVARGAIVDEDALLEALNTGRLWGAALDAFVREPLPKDSPLRHMPKVVATPHAAGSTKESRARIWHHMLDNLDRLAAGRELRNVVNLEA